LRLVHGCSHALRREAPRGTACSTVTHRSVGRFSWRWPRRTGNAIARPAVAAAVRGDRDGVVVALARERDRLQRVDRGRVEAYASAAQEVLEAFSALPTGRGAR
jgi:hypothetical protein